LTERGETDVRTLQAQQQQRRRSRAQQGRGRHGRTAGRRDHRRPGGARRPRDPPRQRGLRRPGDHGRPHHRGRPPADASRRRDPSRTGNGAATASALETARARQRDEYGGINWGASFFGWLVAVGVAALLTAILAAAGAAIGLTTTSESEATANAEEIGLGGGIALVIVLMLAYYAGGYVAGRMSRFDGGRQGLGTWLIGLIVTIGLAIAAVVLGDEYNVLEQLNLPSLPVGDQTLATGGIIALVAIVLGSLLAAMFGGKVGERYHKRVDRAGFID
jgi:hypothetical protein